ncbi:MAG: PIN domain-containing protein [Clostridiales bacterium]|nr:PIN domain-containing protein [Clostridiales bacterium]
MDNIEGLNFLIDYENVNESGLDGAEHLYRTDSLAVFYSKACGNISRKMMNMILESRCEFYAFRLKKAGKNALDFTLFPEWES